MRGIGHEAVGRHTAVPRGASRPGSAAGPRLRRVQPPRPWGIPKGEPDETETDLEKTARRETREETGVEAGELVGLGDIVYSKSRKRVHCYAGAAPAGAAPRPASWEVDQASFVSIDKARHIIHPDQAAFLDRLLAHLRERKA